MLRIFTSKITLAIVGALFLAMVGSLVVITPPTTKRAILTPGGSTHTSTPVVRTPASTPLPTVKAVTPIPKKTAQPQATKPIAKPTPIAQPPLPVVVLTAQDTFHRTDTPQFWGNATDGQAWGADANSSDAFSITNEQGVVQGTGVYTGVLGPTASNTNVLIEGSVETFDGESNIGSVVRWTDSGTWYKAYIDGTAFVLLKSVGGVTSVLASTPFLALDGFTYSIRFQATGSLLEARVWPTRTPEPSRWLLSAHDSAISQGHVGVRLVLTNNIVTIAMFSAKRIG